MTFGKATSQKPLDTWETDGGHGTSTPASEGLQNMTVNPTQESESTMARQIAEAASAFQEQLTGQRQIGERDA